MKVHRGPVLCSVRDLVSAQCFLATCHGKPVSRVDGFPEFSALFFSPKRISRDIQCNSINPGRERVTVVIPFRGGEHPQKNILRQVFNVSSGLVPRLCRTEPGQNSSNRSFPAAHKHREGLRVSPAAAHHQLMIRDRHAFIQLHTTCYTQPALSRTKFFSLFSSFLSKFHVPRRKQVIHCH